MPPCPFLFGLCVPQVASAQLSALLGLLFRLAVSGPPMVIATVALEMARPVILTNSLARMATTRSVETPRWYDEIR